jgi:hypothetical protein
VAVRVSYTRTVKPNFWLDGSSADWAILNFHREKVVRMPNTVPVGLSGSQLRGINKLSDREFSISRTNTKKNQFLRKIIDFSQRCSPQKPAFWSRLRKSSLY